MHFWRSEISSVALPKASWPLVGLGIVLAAEIAAVLSLAFVPILFPFSFNKGNLILFLVSVPLAGLLVGLPAWWRFVARQRQTRLRRGIFLGMLSGLVAHPFVWICCMLLSSLLGMDFLVVDDPLLKLLLIVPFSLMSLASAGWITAIVGGIAGGLLVLLTRRLRRRDESVSVSNG